MKSPSTQPYGAEYISSRYNGSLLWSMTAAMILVVGSLLYPFIADALRKPSEEKLPIKVARVINYSELQAPPPIDLERRIPEPIQAAPKAKTVRYLPPVVKKDEEVLEDDMMPTRDELGKAMIGTQNVEGMDSIYVDPSEALVVSAPIEESKPEEVFTFVEIMPEFPGGKGAFMEWLAANMRYPAMAREAEIQGTVFVSFVIAADGSISEVEVVRSVHPLLDEEAVRVISSMPPWKPGKQNQMAVSVRFTLPVGFKLRY